MYGIFSSRTYDSLDPQDESFIKDYEIFITLSELGEALKKKFS